MASVGKILIADDDPVTRSVLGQAFKSEGFGIAAATDGIEACTTALAEPPAAALVDLLLPRRDGYSVLLFLRSREATRHVPVIILSGEPSEEHSEIARALGAQGYIPKPFGHASVVAKVKEVLRPA